MALINESKTFQSFRSEIESLKQHLQVIDACIVYSSISLKKHKNKGENISTALKVTPGKHDTLNHPVSEYQRIFNYTRAKNAEFSYVEIYNAFSIYLRGILGEMYQHNPLQIVGKATGNPNFNYVELVKFGNYEKIQEEMINKVFRKLEDERSTVKLLDKVLNHTEIQIPISLKANALMYLEMRHLFIHNNGKADDLFVQTYGDSITVRPNNKLPTNFETLNTAIQTVYNLIDFIDKDLIRLELVNRRR